MTTASRSSYLRFRADFEIRPSDPYSIRVTKYGLAPWGYRWLAVGEKMKAEDIVMRDCRRWSPVHDLAGHIVTRRSALALRAEGKETPISPRDALSLKRMKRNAAFFYRKSLTPKPKPVECEP